MFETIGISVSARCNLRCSHCLQGQHFAQDLDPSLLARILREASELGISHASLSGGEPTLYPHLTYAIEEIKSLGLSYSLTTNGLLETVILKAAMLYLPSHITVSLDGHDRRTHDLTRGEGSFDRTIRSLAYLTLSGLRVNIQCTILLPQMDHLDELMHLTQSVGAERLTLVLPVPSTYAFLPSRYPTYAEMVKVKHWISSRQQDLGKPQVALALGNRLLVDPTDSVRKPTCRFLERRDLFVDWNGMLSLCCQTSSVGQVGNEQVADLNLTNLHTAVEASEQMMDAIDRSMGEEPHPFGCVSCFEYLNKIPDNFPSIEQIKVGSAEHL